MVPWRVLFPVGIALTDWLLFWNAAMPNSDHGQIGTTFFASFDHETIMGPF